MDYGHGISDVSTYSDTLRMMITEYLARTITLDELDRWVTAATWFASREPELDALVGEIMLRVAEYQQGHRTDNDVRNHLESLLASDSAGAGQRR